MRERRVRRERDHTEVPGVTRVTGSFGSTRFGRTFIAAVRKDSVSPVSPLTPCDPVTSVLSVSFTKEIAMRRVVSSGAVVVLLAAVLAWPMSAAAPTAKPEDVGFSSERLHRITDLVQRHITAGDFSGAVTLVARNGRI